MKKFNEVTPAEVLRQNVRQEYALLFDRIQSMNLAE